MKNLFLSSVLFLLMGGLFACSSESADDDDNTTPPVEESQTPGVTPTPTSVTPTPSPTPEPEATIVGSWRSEGSDVAPDLAYFFTKIDATFNADLSYEVIATDSGGTEYTYTGTYISEESSVEGIFEIALNQSSPEVVVSEGIYQIDASVTPNRMTYEVVQTNPSLGTPPTPEGGFGSSVGGTSEGSLTQKYSRL